DDHVAVDSGTGPGSGHDSGWRGDPRPGGGAVPRRLTRRLDNKMLGGVASGLGDYFNVDPVLFRVGFVVAALVGGAGLIAYGLAWILLPASTGPQGPVVQPARGERLARSIHRSPGWLGVALAVLGGALILGSIARRAA